MGTHNGSVQGDLSTPPAMGLALEGMMDDLGISRLNFVAEDTGRGQYFDPGNFPTGKAPANLASKSERQKSSAWKKIAETGIHDDDFAQVKDLDPIANGSLHRQQGRAATHNIERRGLRVDKKYHYDVMNPRPLKRHRNQTGGRENNSGGLSGSISSLRLREQGPRRQPRYYDLEMRLSSLGGICPPGGATKQWDRSSVARTIPNHATNGSKSPDMTLDFQEPPKAPDVTTALEKQRSMPVPITGGVNPVPLKPQSCTADKPGSIFEAKGTKQLLIGGEVVDTPLKVKVFELLPNPGDGQIWILEIIQDQRGSMKLDLRSVKNIVLDCSNPEVAYIVSKIKTEDVETYCGDVRFANRATAAEFKESHLGCQAKANASKAPIFGPEIVEGSMVSGTQGGEDTSQTRTPKLLTSSSLRCTQQCHATPANAQSPENNKKGLVGLMTTNVDLLSQVISSSQNHLPEEPTMDLSPPSDNESEDLIDFGPEEPYEPYDSATEPTETSSDQMQFTEQQEVSSMVASGEDSQCLPSRLAVYESGFLNYFAGGLYQIRIAYPAGIRDQAPTDLAVSYLWTVPEFRQLGIEDQDATVKAFSQAILRHLNCIKLPTTVLLRIRDSASTLPFPKDIVEFNKYVRAQAKQY